MGCSDCLRELGQLQSFCIGQIASWNLYKLLQGKCQYGKLSPSYGFLD